MTFYDDIQARELEALRQDRIDEMMRGNPEGRRRYPRPTVEPEPIEFRCAHRGGCDTVLTGDEPYPGWLCTEHYGLPENRRFMWEKRNG